MGNMAKIELIVDVGKDPIERRTDGGIPVISFRAAESYHVPGKDGGESKKVTSWYDVSIFGEDLAKAARFLKKGSRVFIEGRPRVKTFAGWIGIAVNARRIVLLDHKPAETVPEETAKVAESGVHDYYVESSMDNDVEMMAEEAVEF